MGAHVAEHLGNTFTEVDGGALIVLMECTGHTFDQTTKNIVRQGRFVAVELFFRPNGYITHEGVVQLYSLLKEVPTFGTHLESFKRFVLLDFEIQLD